MKRIAGVMLVVGLVAFSAVAASNEVNSVNVVGFNNVTAPSGDYIMVSAPFIQMGDEGIQEVFGDQLTSGTSIGNADTILFWDGATQSYIPNWKHAAGWVQGAQLSTQTVYATRCFWIKSNASTNQNVTMSGEVVVDNTVTQRVYQGFSMMCYPFNAGASVTDTALDALATPGTSIGNADTIFKWDAETQSYVPYWKHAAGWVKGAQLVTPTFEMGEGFFFQHRGAAVDWVETVPYSL